MPTLAAWITKQAGDEPIEGVVIGEMEWGADAVPGYDAQPRGKVLSWSEALPHLQYEFSAGYGAPECNAITAWSRSWVIAICQYDGSTSPFRLPRNPTDHQPEMPGG